MLTNIPTCPNRLPVWQRAKKGRGECIKILNKNKGKHLEYFTDKTVPQTWGGGDTTRQARDFGCWNPPQSFLPCWPTFPGEPGLRGTAPGWRCKWPDLGAHSASVERAQRSGKGRPKPQQLHTGGNVKPGSYLSIGCGFKEAEAVPEALTGQAQLDLLLQDGGSTLQNDLVILHPKQPTTSATGLWSTSHLVYAVVSTCTAGSS